MSSVKVTYKTLAPGCTVEVRPYVPGSGEERALQAKRRNAKASAGLTVETGVAFPIGSLVVLDLTFPGQPFTYRSRGMVSWVTQSQRSDGLFNIGVLVFGMDKLDSSGINLSRAPELPSYSLAPVDPAMDSAVSLSPPIEQPSGRSLRDSEPAPAWPKLMGSRRAEPQPRVSSSRGPDSARGALVSMCAVDLKIARWMGTATERIGQEEHVEKEPSLHEIRATLEAQGKAEPTRPPGSPYGLPTHAAAADPSHRVEKTISPVHPRVSRPPRKPPRSGVRPEKEDALPVRIAAPGRSPSRSPSSGALDPLASTMLAVPRASRPERPVGRRTSEIPVLIEEEPLSTVEKYDSEERTIEAFERIHGLYRCEDRKSSAGFVLELAQQLVGCEAAVCWLIAEKSPRLEVVAARGTMVLGLEGTMMEFGAGLPGKSVREGRVIRSTSASDLSTYNEPPYDLAGQKTPLRSVLVTPVMQDGHTVGAIELLHSPRRHGFAQGEANVLSYLCVALAEHLGSALLTGEEAQ